MSLRLATTLLFVHTILNSLMVLLSIILIFHELRPCYLPRTFENHLEHSILDRQHF